MLKVIIKVVVALLFLAYGAFFLAWNMKAETIVGFQWGADTYSQILPVGALAFVGLIIGALIMAIAAWSSWATQKTTADRATAMVKKAKTKLQAQLDTINELRDEVDRLQAEVASLQAGDGTWGKVTHDDVPAAGEESVDDDDVI